MDNAEQFRAKLARYARGAPGVTRPEPAPPPDMAGPESVGAELVSTDRGRFWMRSTKYNPADPWGEMLPEADCSRAQSGGLRIPFGSPADRVPLQDCLFVDCETTGLSGGAGTISFLTAVGQWNGRAFVVDQYFLPEPADEAAVLGAIERRFESAAALVSYNGAAFDLPLLEGRFHFWRLDPAFRALPHLDLLWPTRAVFKHRIGDCSLGNLERRLLRYARVEDLPGAEVPQVYFDYLREGTSPRLHAVFEHNRFDVVSLFVYALWLDRATSPEQPELADPDDLMALARLWFRRGQSDAALRALTVAGERVLDPAQQARIAELRARILKRARAYEDAHSEWEKVHATSQTRPEVAEELAKHLEHRRKDFAGALAIVDRALEALRFREMIGDDDIEHHRRELLHRRARLKRRLAKQTS